MSENLLVKSFVNDSFSIRSFESNGTMWFMVKDIMDSVLLTGKRSISTFKLAAEDKRFFSKKEFQSIIELYSEINNRGIWCVTEPGLYAILMQTRTSKRALEFQYWLAHEVLPSIRANGGYILGQEDLSAEDAEELNKEIRELSRKVDRLTARVQNLQDVNGRLKESNDHLHFENDSLLDTITELRYECDRAEDRRIRMDDGSEMTEAEYEKYYR